MFGFVIMVEFVRLRLFWILLSLETLFILHIKYIVVQSVQVAYKGNMLEAGCFEINLSMGFNLVGSAQVHQ